MTSTQDSQGNPTFPSQDGVTVHSPWVHCDLQMIQSALLDCLQLCQTFGHQKSLSENHSKLLYQIQLRIRYCLHHGRFPHLDHRSLQTLSNYQNPQLAQRLARLPDQARELIPPQ